MTAKAYGGHLDRWVIIDVASGWQQIAAIISNHPGELWENGEEMVTPALDEIDLPNKIVSTWNAIYSLGISRDDFDNMVAKAKQLALKKQST